MSAIDRDLSLALAKTQANLDLVASRFDILSDLGDLKEFKKLEAECKLTIRELAAAGRVPEDPLASLESELVHLCEWAKEAQRLLDEAEEVLDEDRLKADAKTAGSSRIGTAEIQSQLTAAQTFLRALPDRCETLAARCPGNFFLGPRIDPRVTAIWALRTSGRTRGWESLGKKLPDVARLRAWVAADGGKASEQRGKLGARLEERMALLESWQSACVGEGEELEEALRQIERGHPQAARGLQRRSQTDRFANPLWRALRVRLEAFTDALARVKSASSPRESLSRADRLRGDPSWSKVEPHSEFGAALGALEESAQRSRRNRVVAIVASAVVLLAVGAFAKRAHDKQERLREMVEESIWLGLVPIKGGFFRMGSEQVGGEPGPMTQVYLRDFALGRTEITQAQWKAVMGANPSRFQGDSLPVENVSWKEAMAFCRKSPTVLA